MRFAASAIEVVVFLSYFLLVSAQNAAGSNVTTRNETAFLKNNVRPAPSTAPRPKINSTDHRHQSSFNKNASFLSLMTDSSQYGAKVLAEVVNYELSPAAYAVYLNNCSKTLPTEIIELEPAVDTSLPHETNLRAKKSQVFLIPPLRARTFMIDLDFQKYSKRLQLKASCIISIYNRYNEQLRSKLIDFSPGDTCVCSSNCSCACAKEDPYLICHKINDDELVSKWLLQQSTAGAQTGIAKESSSGNDTRSSAIIVESAQAAETAKKGVLGGSDGNPEELPSGSWKDELDQSIQELEDSHMEYLNLFLLIIIILLLLLLGTCKGLSGICCYPVGRCCLRRFYDKPRILSKYYEPKYANYSVMHDSAGYPLDPFTRKRTVKRLNPVVAFFLNVIFFLCFPFFCLVWLRHCFTSSEDDYAGFDSDEEGPGSSQRRSVVENRTRIKSLDDSRDVADYKEGNNVRVPVVSEGYDEERYPHSREASSDEGVPEMYADDDGIPEEGEANAVNAFHHSEPIGQQNFIAGHAHVYQNQDLSPIPSTPLPNSSTLLQGLTRDPEPYVNDPRRDGPLQVCCGTAAYGSWHRTPEIFGNVYDGDSRFDLHRTAEITRRRRTDQSKGSHLLD